MYAFGEKILAADYNIHLTGDALGVPNHEVPNITSLLGNGFGKFGYGQTITQSSVTVDKVTATQWNYIHQAIIKLANHQNTIIQPMSGTVSGVTYSLPVNGGKIKAFPNITTNLNTLATSSLNALNQGTVTTHQQIHNADWKNSITFTHVVSFETPDHARYFFNAGGQLKLTYAHPTTGTGDVLKMNTLFTNLCSMNNGIGRVYISSPNTGTVKLKTNTFAGITRGTDTQAPVAGLLPATTLISTYGYYGMPTIPLDTVKFTGLNLAAVDRFNGYNSSNITTSVMSNGPSTLNGDNGSVITIQTTYSQIPDGTNPRIIASANASVTLSVIRPSTTYLTATWGNVTVSMSSSGT